MLRNGIFRSPVKWAEVRIQGKERYADVKVCSDKDTEVCSVRGLLMKADPSKEADMVVYYCHGKTLAPWPSPSDLT